jgi:polysaccharide biosynthesis/export protein
MGNSVKTLPTASPDQPVEPGRAKTARFSRLPRGAGIMALWVGLAFLAGCSSGSTPLYYTSKSSQPAPPPPGMQVQQPAAPAPASTPSQAQVQPPAPQPQAQVGSGNLQQQQRLMMQAALAPSTTYRDYKVGPEDLLFIDVYGQEALRRELRVNGQGQISMPLVGVIGVGGLTTQQIENRLREAYGSQFLRNPQITVEVKEFHHQRVGVTGAVAKPGYYDIIGPRTILEVLSMAGGILGKPGPEAGDVIHVIKRQGSAGSANIMKTSYAGTSAPQSKTILINRQQLVSGQSPELNIMVENGDIINVPFAGSAYVLGAVKKPTDVPVKGNLTLSQAIALAQGVDPIFANYKVTVMRYDEQGRPSKIETDLKDIIAGKNPDIPVKENDVIVVNEGELKTKLWVIRQIIPLPGGGYSIPTR